MTQLTPKKTSLQRDPAGRICQQCKDDLDEIIPLDINGVCHGCGANYGRKS